MPKPSNRGRILLGFLFTLYQATSFHPDFILWLVSEQNQHLTYVAPKSNRNLGATDPRIQVNAMIKEIEQRLGNLEITLFSFIVSNTTTHTMQMLWNTGDAQMAKGNMVFQDIPSYSGDSW